SPAHRLRRKRDELLCTLSNRRNDPGRSRAVAALEVELAALDRRARLIAGVECDRQRRWPMRWDDFRRSDNVEDAGSSGGFGFGGGFRLGGGAIIAVVVISLLLGKNPLDVLTLLE